MSTHAGANGASSTAAPVANGAAVPSPPPLSSATTPEVPVEVASLFYSRLNEPKPTSMDFSRDGNFFLSTHADDSVRVIDVATFTTTDAIRSEAVGARLARFTQSSSIACVAPRHHLDGQLHLLNLETAQFVGEMAYLNDHERELQPVPSQPVYSALMQCPATDVIAAVVSPKRCVALFHPLISGAVAASPEHSLSGPQAAISFSPDGNTFGVGDGTRVTIFDRRFMLSMPVFIIETKDIFRESTANAKVCKGIEYCADGEHLLLTASSGEVVVYNQNLSEVVCNYFHNDARRHFNGSAEAVGAKYVHPHDPLSRIAQPTVSMEHGRHLLVYEGYNPEDLSPHLSEHGALLPTFRVKPGPIAYEVQSKDSDVVIGMAVNPRYSLVATGARNITWWSFNNS